MKHEENSADIKLNESGLLEVAEMVSLQDSTISEKVSATNLVELYSKRIKSDDNALEDLECVPKVWRQKVKDKLVKDGYVKNEDGSAVKR